MAEDVGDKPRVIRQVHAGSGPVPCVTHRRGCRPLEGAVALRSEQLSDRRQRAVCQRDGPALARLGVPQGQQVAPEVR